MISNSIQENDLAEHYAQHLALSFLKHWFSVLSLKKLLFGAETCPWLKRRQKLLNFYLIPRVLIHFLITTILFLVTFILALSLFKLPFHVILILSRCFCSIFLFKCSNPNWRKKKFNNLFNLCAFTSFSLAQLFQLLKAYFCLLM